MMLYTSYSCLYKLMFSVTKITTFCPFPLQSCASLWALSLSSCVWHLPTSRISTFTSNQLVFKVSDGWCFEGERTQTAARFKVVYFCSDTNFLKEWERNSLFPWTLLKEIKFQSWLLISLMIHYSPLGVMIISAFFKNAHLFSWEKGLAFVPLWYQCI